MTDINRRSFLKKAGLAVGTVMIGGKLFSFPEAVAVPSGGDAFVVDGNILGYLRARIEACPPGHVAHTITQLEVVRDPDNFGSLVRGLSIVRGEGKYYAFKIEDEDRYMSDFNMREKIFKAMCEALVDAWRRTS